MAHTVTWRQLRRMAEAAHGLEDRRVGIRKDGRKFVVEEWTSRSASRYLFDVKPRKQKKKKGKLMVLLPGVSVANLRAKGIKVPKDENFAKIADMVMWSHSAIEKFLIPYYASYRDLSDVMNRIRKRFDEAEVLAYIHLPNSEVVDDGPDTKKRIDNLFAIVPDKKRGEKFLDDPRYKLERVI